MSAYFGVVFGSVEIGLVVAVSAYTSDFFFCIYFYKKMICVCILKCDFFGDEGGNIDSKVVAVRVEAEDCGERKHTKHHDI